MSNADDEVYTVRDLKGHYDHACYLGHPEQHYEGQEDESSRYERNKDIILCPPSLGRHLFDKDVVIRVIYLKFLVIAYHSHEDKSGN